ncbi:maleylpyruvate isomerase family mycothiol-dependent enzyme [Streptomyces europaeiscabiei]|uniref:maleylpyruvate isomerase family mycothiol-dependent enzyme n=1 Tax=Streptomyces europaeiscabiei TaxID=146819 RepID=UPI002E186DF6|nr:maleylpyruvate isomerase family mycothiol-dependent enzyme [Streptomyces europaeiscabiei]
MSGPPHAMLDWVGKGTAAFEAATHWATDASLTRPSHLPGWSRAHVVAHVARNAHALVNLLTWARTGVETPMYADDDQRMNEIEANARRPADELRAALLAADGRLRETLTTLPDECWSATVRTARGRAVSAAEVPWMRVREVWVHAVDLNTGTSFDDVPREVCAGLVDDVAAAFRARSNFPLVELRADDGGRTWLLGEPGAADPVVVSGDIPSLAAYATGRPVPGPLYVVGGSVPILPPWL